MQSDNATEPYDHRAVLELDALHRRRGAEQLLLREPLQQADLGSLI